MPATRHLKGATAAETSSAIIDLIRSSGVVSRTDLADWSGLTAASISRIVKQLLTEGVVVEVGQGDRTGGKRRTLLELNPGARHAIGVTLDADINTYLLTDLNGTVIAHVDAPGIGTETPHLAIERIGQELVALIKQAGVDRSTVLGIGVAVAGRQDLSHHVLRSRLQATDWELLNIEERLSASVGLPVAIENDSTCAAIGEHWVGKIPSSVDFATLYMATGFGLGLVVGGDIYRGASANVGEIGHVVLDVNGPDCWCGSRGCLEMLAAPQRVVRLATQRAGLADELGLHGGPDTVRQDFSVIAQAATDGHDAAREIIEESAFYLGRALLSLTNLLDLDQIILAGPGFDEAGPVYRDMAARAVDELAFVRSVHPTTIELSRVGGSSAALGAATLVLYSQLTSPQRSSRTRLPH